MLCPGGELIPTGVGHVPRGRHRQTWSAAWYCIAILIGLGVESFTRRGGCSQETFLGRRRRGDSTQSDHDASGGPLGVEDYNEAAPQASIHTDELLPVPFVELQVVETHPRHIHKIFVPVHREVAMWWASEDEERMIHFRLEKRITSFPRVQVEIVGTSGSSRLQVGGISAPGMVFEVALPDNAVLEACKFSPVWGTAEFEPLASLGRVRALYVVCPVQSSSDSPMEVARKALTTTYPFRWLVMPWLLLLLPFIITSEMGPMALVGGILLTLASIACLSFLLAVLIVVAQRRCATFFRRLRRLYRLRVLARRPERVSAAFGDAGPCCICLAEPDDREKLICLLPCRHALHNDCYISWVRADAYPSHELICPLCRSRTMAIGKL